MAKGAARSTSNRNWGVTGGLGALFIAAIVFCQSAWAATPVQLSNSFAGNVDFVGTGQSLRTASNGTDACAVGNSASATLSGIPSGASIRAAYLYWAGSWADYPSSTQTSPDYTVTFNGQSLSAPASRRYQTEEQFSYNSYNLFGTGTRGHFAGVADVTEEVRSTGNGTYTLADLSVDNSETTGFLNVDAHCSRQTVLSAWSLVVVYEDATEDFRVLNLFEGFEEFQGSSLTLSPSNFEIPSSPINGQIAHITWEGDATNSQDADGESETLSFNGNTLTDSANPPDNQFNSVSTIADSTGATTYGLDSDVYPIDPYLSPGDTSATSVYSSGQDLVLLSAEIISVTNTPVADLAISKSHSGDGQPGTQIDYAITVTNNGPKEEPGPITVTDELPDDTSYDSFSGTGWSCSENAGTVTCDHSGPLATGNSLPTLTLTATVDSSPAETLTNTASVSGQAFDNKPGNDSDTAVIGPKPIKVTLAGAAREINAGAVSLIGTALGGPGATATGTETNDDTIQTTINPQTDNAWVIDGVGAGDSGGFTPGAGQTERWEESLTTAAGAGSTTGPVSDSITVTQEFSPGVPNRMAQAVTSWAPVGGGSINFDAATSEAGTDTETLEWRHELTGAAQQKLVVSIAVEDDADDDNFVGNVTFEGDPLTRVAQVSVASSGIEERVEIWYLDRTTSQLDHFHVSHDNAGITCRAEDVVLRAEDASGDLVTDYTGPVDLSTSTNHGDWAIDTGNGSLNNGGGDDGAATYEFVSGDNGEVRLQFSDTHAETLNIDATDGNVSDDDTEGGMTFADVGVLIDGDGSDSNPETDIGTQIAGKNSNVAPPSSEPQQYVRVIRTDNETGACTAGIGDETRDVTFSYSVPVAAEGLSDNEIIVNDDSGNKLASAGSKKTVQLDFDSDGTAPFHFNSADAGRYKLEVEMDIPVTNTDENETGDTITRTDTSNDFVVRPLAVFADASGGKVSDSNPRAADADDGAFTAAGTEFTLTYKALGWASDRDNDGDGVWDACGDIDPGTPDSELARVPAWGIGEPDFSLEAPSGGASGNLTGAAAAFEAGDDETVTEEGAYSEVGIIHLDQGSIDDFLGKEVEVCSPNIGRFIPDHFSLNLTNTPSFSEANGTFTYLGQTFTYATAPSIQLSAESMTDATTENYEGSFWKLGSETNKASDNNTGSCGSDNGFCYQDQADPSAADLDEVPSTPVPFGDTSDIGGTITLDGIHADKDFQYARPSSETEPFDGDIRLNVSLEDEDGVSGNLTVDHIGFFTDSNPQGSDQGDIGDNLLWQGLMVVRDTHGPETSPLPVPVLAQGFYSGSWWLLDGAELPDGSGHFPSDNSTPLGGGRITITDPPADDLAESDTGVSEVNDPLNGGKGGLVLRAPGDKETGKVTVTADVPGYLEGTGGDPSGIATFGRYRGDDRIIYQQEIFR